MGDSDKRTEMQKSAKDVWSLYQAIFSKLIAENVRRELESAAPQQTKGASARIDIRKTVTEAVGAVLMEPSFLEKILERHIKAYLSKHPTASAPQGQGSGDQQKEIQKIVGEFLSQHLANFIQKELCVTIQREVKELLASNELKEMIDDKFRMISVYMKTEVIPKAVQKELSRSEA